MPLSGERKREYQREWIRKRREEWLVQNGPCVKCGSNQQLEVDHKEPGQKINHRIWSWSKERRESELLKCQILCRECHVKKTHEDFGHREHSAWIYWSKKCRCNICTEDHRLKMQKWRKKVRQSKN